MTYCSAVQDSDNLAIKMKYVICVDIMSNMFRGTTDVEVAVQAANL